ncbi:MAG: heat-inducible transcription repressor HrcA [Acidobacteria bacterium]|nr:heat-inducible transcription repressor HrcA [Acidobacteriota bacterium]
MRDFLDLSQRHRWILAALVDEYIGRGEPVSSLWLAAKGRFGVSSATLRNSLASLEDAGYVRQPHASAGRIPTDRGYRCYVDDLLQTRRPVRRAPAVEARLREAGTVDDALSNVSHELWRASHHVGFAVGPAAEVAVLRQIEFVTLSASKVLVVLIAADGHVSRKVIDVGAQITAHELRQASGYLNTEFAGLSLDTIRTSVVGRLQEERTLYDRLMTRALRLASTTLAELVPENVLFIQGASSLLEELARTEERISVDTLRALFKMIEEKHRLVRLLNAYIDGPGLTVVIGSEHTSPDLQNFSLVASTYAAGAHSGSVGIIGPTRMRYSRAIAAVDAMAAALSRALGAAEANRGMAD